RHVLFELILDCVRRQAVEANLARLADPQEVVVEAVLARGEQLSQLVDRGLVVQVHHKAPYYPFIGHFTLGATTCSALPRLLQQHRNRGFLHAAFWTVPSPRTACVTAQAVWNTL